MSSLESFLYLSLGILCLALIFNKKFRKNYPPGPWGLPLVGNIPMMGSAPHEAFVKWAKKYGPVVSIKFGQFEYDAVVINDAKLIREAFNNSEFSGRPPLTIVKDRSGGEVKGILFTEGQEWVEQRRFILRNLRDFGFGKKSMEVIVVDEIKDLIESFRQELGKPQSTHTQFQVAVLNVLWTIVVGERFKQNDPELLAAIQNLTSNIQMNNFLRSMVVFLPFIARLAPKLSGYEKFLSGLWPIIEFLKKPVNHHLVTLQTGQPRDFLDIYLEETRRTTDPMSSFYKEKGEKSALFVILDLFIAGAETTSTTLTWTLLYLAKFPLIQTKLQEEIDRVIGYTRLPSLSDRATMPYTEAVTNEVLRYSSLLYFGILHKTHSEVQLGGFTLPRDTMIIGNLYGAHFDEKYWENPQDFQPERFLNKDGSFNKKNEGFLAFSTGKRACLGETLARDELFLFITSLFQVFQISPEINSKELSIDPIVGSSLSPKPHKLIFSERM